MTETANGVRLGPVLRRVAGVLVEKAKTTPDIYPMTVNAIVTGSNQKSNRHPQMKLTDEDVEEALSDLRQLGAVVEIQGEGRKYRYKHRLYEWLQVDKVQLAVLAELLLRGHQTLGELRARASRMEPIEGLTQLKPIVDDLMAKGLMIALTPEGRGQLVSHNLYLPQELVALENNLQSGHPIEPEALRGHPSTTQEVSDSVWDQIDVLRQQIDQLSQRIQNLEQKRQD